MQEDPKSQKHDPITSLYRTFIKSRQKHVAQRITIKQRIILNQRIICISTIYPQTSIPLLQCIHSSHLIIIQMVITNLQEKENRKLYVPIRPGNRGGWSLFDWEKVREQPYRDREMYLGNSVKIGVLDKGGKWRKKDWYLKKDQFTEEEQRKVEMQMTRVRDQERINIELGLAKEEDQEKLTPQEMQELMKKIKLKKEEGYVQPKQENAIGLGFDKAKVEIRAKPTVKQENPHRLEGDIEAEDIKKEEKSRQKRHRKQKHRNRSRSRSRSHEKRHEKRHKHSRHEKD